LETKNQPVESPHTTATYIPRIGILTCYLCTSRLLWTRVEVTKFHAYFYSTVERVECFEFTFRPLYPQRKRLIYLFYKKLNGSENHFGKKKTACFSLAFAAQLSRNDEADTGLLCRKPAMLGERSEKHPVVIKTKIPFFVSGQVSVMPRNFAG